MTYAELDRQARTIAAQLQRLGAAGERVLLLYPPGLTYIAAFFGCLYAGAVAVPAYPPNPARLERTLPRLQAIVGDARPLVALSTAAICMMVEALSAQVAGFGAMRWLATDTLAETLAEDWQEPSVGPETLAFLQYTSGSTAEPKGVMLTHGNLLHNLELIHGAFEHSAESCGVIWLPPYHDMGLIGGILQPLYGGFPVTLMSPVAFLQRPLGWLEAISRTRATTSGGPNFAYDLCVRKITPEQRAQLDLSSWRVAFNGAEPIQAATMERFTAAFSACGFRPEAFFPCYGLAEATLIVSGGTVAAPPAVRAFQGPALEHHQAVEAPPEQPQARRLVGCGQPGAGQQLVIAQPETGVVCPPGQVGEIWVAGPSVAQGYWGRPGETAQGFQAFLADSGAGPFLRTGDLGFVQGGELFVTGRLKDLIIIRGRNAYPQDIELTVERCHPALRLGCGAAFAVEVDGEERLVIVQELEHRHQHPDVEQVAAAVRQVVAEQHEIHVYAVALLKTGGIPKTSSGKIQRHACRAGFLSGTLELVGRSLLSEAAAPSAADELTGAELLALVPDERPARLEAYLRAHLAGVLHIAPAQLDARRPLSALGLDSLASIELQYQLETSLGVVVPMADFLQEQTVAQLAARILAEMVASAQAQPALLAAALPTTTDHPLSYGQRALWFIQQLAPASSAYHLTSAARIRASVDVPTLRRAFQRLVERHPSLRTTFITPQGEPLQRVQEQIDEFFQLEDAHSWSDARLDERLAEVANQPFDLQQGPLLRVHLLTRSVEEHVLVLVVHHLVADFWSLAVLLDELGQCYSAEKAGRSPALAPLALRYADYLRWQTELLSGPDGERHWDYWRQQLAGELPVLNLPTDRPRPPVQSYQGAAYGFQLGQELTARLVRLAEAHGATLYTTLVAAFQVLLFRYSGQTDLLVGSPTAGRSRAQLAPVVGYFVNPVVLRGKLEQNPPFSAFLEQTRRIVLEAFAHQDFPFALLAERLQAARDPSRSPIFQVMFVLQKAPLLDRDGLTAFAVGSAGAQIELGQLPLELIALDQTTAQFDLTLTMAEVDGRLHGSFQYSTDLFAPATIARMAAHFQVLLEGIATDPHGRVSALPLLTATERRQVLTSWNATATAYPAEACIHSLFEAQARRTPDATALIVQGQELSYAALNRRANQLAHYLQSLGVGPDVLVGICVERSPEMVVGLLGILKAGSAYVPLDPTYPQERLAFMIEDAQVSVLLTNREIGDRRLENAPARQSPISNLQSQIVHLDTDWDRISQQPETNPASSVTAAHLAYVIYTSGSTGKPKGVMICHRNVVNFFAGMDERVEHDGAETLLAVTSISFDISVLELFWTLTRGMRVVLLGERVSGGAPRKRRPIAKDIQFSLFYFASASAAADQHKYRLVLEGAKFADTHGFTAVWTPERHFHAFGGLYPNPAVMSAALATATERVQLRAGSVVLPLHNPIRVAEEWSLVDNLSNGRVGVAFASGWHADDFAFFPDHYADRKNVMFQGIETVRRLWRNEAVMVRGGAGNEIAVTLFPQPIQAALPIWITAAGSADTFVKAGEIGANVLTHLLGQSIEDVAVNISRYRELLARHGHDPQAGTVTLMLHTLIGEDREAVRALVRQPFTEYLRSSIGLIENLIRSLKLPLDLRTMSAQDMDDLLAFAFDRYFETSALFGTPETCAALIERLKEIGVDEVACLIDFGVAADVVLASLQRLDDLRVLANMPPERADDSLVAAAATYDASILQCTPSMMQMLTLDQEAMQALRSLRLLLLGGEALPPALVRAVQAGLPAQVINQYGPTETTIWSATHAVQTAEDTIPIGRPLANTQIYLLDRQLQPVPIGVAGELYIGGDGLARGYLGRPDLTAERFVPNPFAQERLEMRDWRFGSADTSISNLQSPISDRLYRTGDLARYREDGAIEYLGRIDQQVKICGYRIELEEIETVLRRTPAVRECVVVAREDVVGEKRLVAYVVASQLSVVSGQLQRTADNGASDNGQRTTDNGQLTHQLRQFLRDRLPDYMVPAAFVLLDALPLTANGKIDRKALPAPATSRPELGDGYLAPRNQLEHTIAGIWRDALKLEKVGVHDNFFDLGGHSLLMAQVHSQLREILQQDVPLIKLLEHPTISALAQYLRQSHAEPPSFERSRDRALKQVAGLKRQRQRANPGKA